MKNTDPAKPAPTAKSAADLAILGNFRRALKVYLNLIEEGSDRDLIRELPLHARHIMEALEAAAVTHPELLAGVARGEATWPVLASRHLPQGQDFAALADRIQLGADVVIDVSSRARYRLDPPLNRFLLQMLVHGCLPTPKNFYFLDQLEDRPKLTRQSLPWYLDEYLMPLLDDLREKEGSWDGVPALANLVKGVADPAAQRRLARKHLRLALLEMASPEKEVA